MAQLIIVNAAQVREYQARYQKLFAQDNTEQARLLALEEKPGADERHLPDKPARTKESEARR